MATRTITTRLALDGEQEFKRGLADVNSNLKTMKSEMGLVDAEFKGQANSLDALTKKNKLLRDAQEQQLEKVKALEKAVEDSAKAYGESDKKTDGYRQQLNRAKKELIEMNEALDKNEQYLDEARKSADQCAESIDGFGKEVKDAGDGLGGKSGLLGKLESLKRLMVGGAIVGGAKAVGDAIIGIVEDTEEYRKVMGTLEVSSERAGYTAEQTAQAYHHLIGVLGDTQTAATTVANLQAIGLSQEDLMETINAVVGAWATYGDSIPIDSLSEAVNETIQTSKVTGVFADVLNWAGINEDEFNEKLANANTLAERAQIVMDTLANEGLNDTGKAWYDVNEDVVEYNEAQEEANKAMAELGERLVPVAAKLKTVFASAVNIAFDAVDGLIGAVKEALDWMGQIGTAQSNSAAAHTGRNSSGRDNERSSSNVTQDASAGENAVKESRAATNNAGSTPQTINITVKSELDGKEIGSSVTKYQLQNQRATR